MANKNRYKFHFGEKNLTLTTDKDNLFMEEVERVAHEKYKIIKEQMKNADNETIAILIVICSCRLNLELLKLLSSQRFQLFFHIF
uniref:hypothetical protein n=1 Tax=Streptococcus salivarius TaxID=1304 RepID=UPI00114FB331